MSEFFEASAKEKSRIAARSCYGRVAWRDPVGSAGERWPVLAPGPDQCVRGNDGRAGKNRRSADRREGVRARLQNRHRLLHCQLWCYESHLQPVCRSSFGNRWPQEGFGSRLAAWPSCPFIIIFANRWFWFDVANVMLGVNQALCWSMTVIMKVDLVGPKRRGLALGLNEFAGYLALGFTAWITGYIASVYALRPQPFYLGIGVAFAGLLLSLLLAKIGRAHV